MLIIIAQIIQAIQMVVEEKFVSGQNIPPLQAAGWEGENSLYCCDVNIYKKNVYV